MKITQTDNRSRNEAENTIPLINVVFLMLIFFLLAGTVATPLSPDIEMPETQALAQVPPAENVIQMNKAGGVIYKGQDFTQADLKALIVEKFPPEGDLAKQQGLSILADRHLKLDKLSGLLQMLRQAGYRKIRLVTLRAGA